MIKNIILDIGQVLADFNWKEYIEGLGLDEAVKEKLIQATVLDEKHWGEHDRGLISDEEYIKSSLEIVPGIEKELRLFFHRIHEIVVEYDYAEEFVSNLHSLGYHVYILSNYGATTFQYATQNFKFLQHVDGMVISSQEHYIKPEKEIYHILMERYFVLPEESVFLDDKSANIEAAKKLGFHTILFHSLCQGKEELRGLGVHIK